MQGVESVQRARLQHKVFRVWRLSGPAVCRSCDMGRSWGVRGEGLGWSEDEQAWRAKPLWWPTRLALASSTWCRYALLIRAKMWLL